MLHGEHRRTEVLRLCSYEIGRNEPGVTILGESTNTIRLSKANEHNSFVLQGVGVGVGVGVMIKHILGQ